MKDSSLLLFALFSGIAGLLILQFSALKSDISVSQSLDGLSDYSEVRIVGEVKGVKLSGEGVVLSVLREDFVDVYVPGDFEFSEGEAVDVVGELKQSGSKKLIFASRVTKG